MHGGEDILKAEHRTVQEAEHHSGQTARHKYAPDLHLFQLPHKKTYYRHNKSLPHVAEHNTEEYRICNSNNDGRVYFVVARNAVHLDIEFVQPEKRRILQQNRWRMFDFVLAVRK